MHHHINSTQSPTLPSLANLTRRHLPGIALLLSLLGISGPTLAVTLEITCSPDSICRQTSTGLPLRALPRASSTIYEKADEGSTVLNANVPAFSPLFVFQRQNVDYSDPANPTGWYQVGALIDDPVGWMHARDILEWKQALMVAYSHPGTG